MYRPGIRTPQLCHVPCLTLLLVALLNSGCGGGPSSLEKRTEALIQRHLTDQASELVRAEIEKSPQNARLHALLGRTKLASGDIAGADSSYGRACALDTSYFEPYIARFIAQGGTFVEEGRADLANECFRIALARDRASVTRIATELIAVGTRLLPQRPDGAHRAFDAAFEHDPASRPSIALAYLDAGKRQITERTADAATYFERALGWDPSLSEDVGNAVGEAMARGSAATLEALSPLASRLGAGGVRSLAGAISGRRHSLNVSVAGRTGWARIPFDVAIGDTIALEPQGEVRAEAARDGWISDPCGPRGWPSKSMDWWQGESERLLAPGHPRMALVGRIGRGAPFVVPEGLRMVADGAGPLELAVNDVPRHAAGGAGSFTVRVEGPLSAYRPTGAGTAAVEVK